MRDKIYITFFICALVVSVAHSQDKDCEQILVQADDEFNAGRFYGIPSMLKPCLDGGFSNEQKVRAYLILAQAYLILDDPIAAEDSYLKLLQADPEYVANPQRDPIDVYYLSKKFTSTPVFTPHIRGGLNASRIGLIQEINTSGLPLTHRQILKPGFQIGAGLDFNINNNWSVCAEGNFSRKVFKKEVSGYSKNDILVWTERNAGFDIPIYVKYADDSGKIRPFGYAGIAFNIMLSAKVENVFSDRTPSNPELGIQEISLADEDVFFKRRVFSKSLVLGGGVKYKIGKDFVYIDLRYMAGLSNLTKPEKNYYTQSGAFDPSITTYQYVSDFFRLDNLSLSFGYIHPIYNPRKKGTGVLFGIGKKSRSNKIK
jgi:hypothetical protein